MIPPPQSFVLSVCGCGEYMPSRSAEAQNEELCKTLLIIIIQFTKKDKCENDAKGKIVISAKIYVSDIM